MAECDNPSVELQLLTSCNQYTCKDIEKSSYGQAWERIIQAPQIKISGSWADKSKREKFKQKAKQRSKEDFRETTWDSLDAAEKEHHKINNPDDKLFK